MKSPTPTPALNEETLRAATKSGDAESVIALFSGRSEKERASWMAFIRAEQTANEAEMDVLYEKRRSMDVWQSYYDERGVRIGGTNLGPAEDISWIEAALKPLKQCRARLAAAWHCCASFSELKKDSALHDLHQKTAFEIFHERRPPWLQEWVDWVVHTDLYPWDTVRALTLSGVCRDPDHPPYQLQTVLLAGLPEWQSKGWKEIFLTDGWSRRGGGAAIEDFRKNWAVIGPQFWKVFEIEGTVELSAEWLGSGEFNLVPALCGDGLLDRQRLLGACLQPLEREFAQARGRWFAELHEMLKPTPDERALLLDRYLPLLESTTLATVTFALNAISALHAVRPIPGQRLLPFLRPVMLAKAKATVKAGVKLVHGIVGREPDQLPAAAELMAQGFLHPTQEMQEAAVAWLEKHRAELGAALPGLLEEYLASVAVSLRQRVAALMGHARSKAMKAEDSVGSVAPSLHLPASHLDPSRVIPPISDLEELISLASSAIENLYKLKDPELVVSGIAHWHTQRPDDFETRTSPLRKRLKQVRKDYLPVLDLSFVDLIACWLTRSDTLFRSSTRVMEHLDDEADASALTLWCRHTAHVCKLIVQESPLPLLAAPTHLGGWIDPVVLVQRLNAWQQGGETPPDFELCWALLRLAPENRPKAFRLAEHLAGEQGQAVRFALGSEREKVGANAGLWIAACRSREPDGTFLELEAMHPGMGGDTAHPCRFAWSIVPVTSWPWFREEIAVEPSIKTNTSSYNPVAMMAHHWGQPMWPAKLDHFFSERMHSGFIDGLDTRLNILLDPLTPIGTSASLILLEDLGCQVPETETLTVDVLSAAIATSRLNLGLFAEMVAGGLAVGLPLKRRMARLGELAAMSPQHGLAVWEVLTKALQGEPRPENRDLLAVLELLRDLSAEHGLLPEPTQAFLRKVATGGRTKTLIGKLLRG